VLSSNRDHAPRSLYCY